MCLSSETSSAYPFQYARAVGILYTRIFNKESLLKLTSFIIPSVHFKLYRADGDHHRWKEGISSIPQSPQIISLLLFNFPFSHIPSIYISQYHFLAKWKINLLFRKSIYGISESIQCWYFPIRFPLAVRFLSVISQNYSNSDVRGGVEVCWSDHFQHYHLHCCFHFHFPFPSSSSLLALPFF